MTRSSTSALRRLADAGRHDLARQLDGLLAVVAAQAAADEDFAYALIDALADTPLPTSTKLPRTRTEAGSGSRNVGGRRPPGPFDPYEAYAEGEDTLRRRLELCEVEQLKDIVAEHGMDHDRLALKWKTPERLIERIVETVAARASKGDAFRGPISPPLDEQRKNLWPTAEGVAAPGPAPGT